MVDFVSWLWAKPKVDPWEYFTNLLDISNVGNRKEYTMKYKLVVKQYKKGKETNHYAFPNKTIEGCWSDLNENHSRLVSSPFLSEQADRVIATIELNKSVIYTYDAQWITKDSSTQFESNDVFSNDFKIHLLHEIAKHNTTITDIIDTLESKDMDDSIDDIMMRADLEDPY
jgi:hypothetical protein